MALSRKSDLAGAGFHRLVKCIDWPYGQCRTFQWLGVGLGCCHVDDGFSEGYAC